MPDFAVILPRVLEVDEVAALACRGMTVSATQSATGLRVAYLTASDRRAAVDQVLNCVNLTAWEAEGVRIFAAPLNRQDGARRSSSDG